MAGGRIRPSRRDFVRLAGAAAASAATMPLAAPSTIAQTDPRVVIVGGGAGGATVAHHLRAGAPDLDITLIEASPIYSSSFFSNHYLGGIRALETLNHGYAGLQRIYVKVVHDLAVDVNPARKAVRTRGGRTYSYDRLVLSPGIDIDYGSVEGYSREVSGLVPHAYTTGAAQKRLLKTQLQQMRAGGTVVMAIPGEPYRCPTAPYERACMIAHFLKARKARSKLVILDAKRSFPQQALFEEAFAKYYRGVVELHLSTEIDDFSVARLNPRTREIVTRAGKKVRADVANVIPRQRAGEIAARAGCTLGDWCPVHPETFLSRIVPDVYVLGDAANAAGMPKSASAANSQAHAVAADILAALVKAERAEPRYRTSCWSLLAPDDSVKMTADYTARSGRLEAGNAVLSSTGEPVEQRKQNYQDSLAWYSSMTDDIFAKSADRRDPAANGPSFRQKAE
jgi:NADPH-dependent 2,4-dienoyl-CoA reductase/sulfur reductase-like enzyme